jgi:hypothetical protein
VKLSVNTINPYIITHRGINLGLKDGMLYIVTTQGPEPIIYTSTKPSDICMEKIGYIKEICMKNYKNTMVLLSMTGKMYTIKLPESFRLKSSPTRIFKGLRFDSIPFGESEFLVYR